jgi:type IX secretion system PorP/SprF family membrane protein
MQLICLSILQTILQMVKRYNAYSTILCMKNRIGYLVVMLLFAQLQLQAQDPHFSQFFEANMLRNPALAGLFQGDFRISGVYRNQWASVSTPFVTGAFAAEYKKPIGQADDYLTLGAQLLYDKAGTASLATTHVMPALNYHKSLNGEKSKYLSLGITAGLVQRRFDRTKMTTNNHFDGNGYNPALPDGEVLLKNNFNYIDGAVGLSYNSSIGGKTEDNYFVGVAYHHFNRPKNSFYRNPEIELQSKMVFSSGVKFTLNETSYFTIHANYTQQGSYTELIGGAIYSYKIGEDIEEPNYTVHLGAFIRAKDAVIPMVKLDYHPFSFAFSYDANVSQLRTASMGRGGLELSIAYTGFVDRSGSSKYVPLCPKF